MNLSPVISEKQLKKDFNIGQRPALKRFLMEKKIPFELNHKGEVWTVAKAIEGAVIKKDVESTDDDWEGLESAQAT